MILALQHVPWERMGLIEQVLAAKGLSWRTVRAYAGERIPRDLEGLGGLVLMGGPMAVYQQNLYPYLRDEVVLIEKALAREVPLLGICLGSELMAQALGARVHPAADKEIGWFPVWLSPEGTGDSVMDPAPRSFTAFHWHGDEYDLPPGTVPLARSDRTPVQAFRYGKNAYGFLFHMEVTELIVEDMIERLSQELREVAVDPQPLLQGCNPHLEELHQVGRAVFGRWTALVATPTD